MIAMKVTLGLESSEADAIREFHTQCEHQDRAFDPDTVVAHFAHYEMREEEYTAATKVERTIFTAVATEYQKFTRTVPVGKIWVVRAQEPPPTYPINIKVGYYEPGQEVVHEQASYLPRR